MVVDAVNKKKVKGKDYLEASELTRALLLSNS